jgi:hypothetical protein
MYNRFMTSENGWTNDKLFIDWFRKVFLPGAEAHRDPDHPDAPFLLIVDGHGSHETAEFLTLAREHNVFIYRLPPHTTHQLQPLDVGVFGPLQREWQKRCEHAITTTGEGIRREYVPREYFITRSIAFKRDTILKSFKSCGIRPLGNRFIDADFAMAKATSTSACVPEGFPAEAPSADDVELLIELGLVDDIFIPEHAAMYSAHVDDDLDDDRSDIEVEFDEDGEFRHCVQEFDGDGYLTDSDDDSSDDDSDGMDEDEPSWMDEEMRDEDASQGPRYVPPRSLYVGASTNYTSMHRSPSPEHPPSSSAPPPSPLPSSSTSRVPSAPARPLSLAEQNALLKKENDALKVALNTAQAHSKLAYAQLGETRDMLYSKKTPRRRGIALSSQALNTDEGLAAIAERDRLQKEKATTKQKAADARDADKQKKDAERSKLTDADLFKVRICSYSLITL